MHIVLWVLQGILEIKPLSAAAGVGGLQLGSIFLHLRSREKPRLFVSLALFAFAALVAWGRSGRPPY